MWKTSLLPIYPQEQLLQSFNLESSVEREKDVQGIDVHREFEKSVVTLLVMSIFSNFLGVFRACAGFRDSTEESRFNYFSP